MFTFLAMPERNKLFLAGVVIVLFAIVGGIVHSQAGANTEPGLVVDHGTENVVVPPDVQRSALLKRLDSTEAWLERLDALDPGRATQARATLDSDITEWKARLDRDDFEPITIEMPYVHLGTSSIYWSQFSYDGADWDANQRDPTNVVVWGEATAADFDDRMRTDTRSTHRWEDDDGGACIHVTQYVAMRNHSTYPWTWVASDGLQHVPDACASGTREHLRFWSLNSWDPDFGYWTLVAAHEEHFVFPGHDIDSWENGENLVQNSFRSSDNGSLLSWVDGIVNQDFGNAGTYQDAYNNGLGRLIEVSAP